MSVSPGLHPAEAPRPGDSHAEARVHEALQRQLPAGWFAWHSLRIRGTDGIQGEGDFVLAVPDRGLLVVEVKGGRVEQRDGRWFQDGRPMERAPREQAERYARKLLERLTECGVRSLPPWGTAVCFPDVAYERPPTQDDLRGIVLGQRELSHLDVTLPAALDAALPPGRRPGAPFVEALHRLWGESWVPRPSLGSLARDGAERFLQLGPVELAILDGVARNDRVLVSGAAGSGKTLMALQSATRHAALGQRVLVVCFTRSLSTWLRRHLAPVGVEVRSVSDLALTQLAAAGGAPSKDPVSAADWDEVCLDAAASASRDWDTVIVDEAQDLTAASWLLLQAICEQRRLWAFHDERQRFWPDRVPPPEEQWARFDLPTPHRCPAGVQALANAYAGGHVDDGAVATALRGGSLGLVVAPTAASLGDKLGAEVDRLLSDGLRLSDIAIVSVRGQTAPDAVYHRARVGRHEYVHADAADMGERLVADSFLRLKGLERPAIIVTDLGLLEARTRDVRMYIALTRALLVARIAGTREDLAADPRLRAMLA